MHFLCIKFVFYVKYAIIFLLNNLGGVFMNNDFLSFYLDAIALREKYREDKIKSEILQQLVGVTFKNFDVMPRHFRLDFHNLKSNEWDVVQEKIFQVLQDLGYEYSVSNGFSYSNSVIYNIHIHKNPL